MGISQTMQENMKKNMEQQMAFQKDLIVKQRQTQMAMQIAMGRQRFWYYQVFYFIAAPFMLLGAIKQKNLKLISPLVPLTIAYAFQYDNLYGNMFQRAQKTADDLLGNDANKFYFPKNSGLVTLQEYEKILGIKNGKKIVLDQLKSI